MAWGSSTSGEAQGRVLLASLGGANLVSPIFVRSVRKDFQVKTCFEDAHFGLGQLHIR